MDEHGWWVGHFYTLLMPSALRQRLAAHFTPPAVARRVLTLAIEAGLDLTTARILDPAAGGAAFLSTVAGIMQERAVPTKDILARLHGVEIDPYLAQLAEAILAHRLGVPYSKRNIVKAGDSLSLQYDGPYDAVLANPPYGRLLGLSRRQRLRWAHLANPGHVNLYAIFVGLSLDLLRTGGLAALVLPASFLAGPIFTRLRKYIQKHSEVISIDILNDRNGVFFDVSQDTCVMLLRKGQAKSMPRWGLMSAEGSLKPLGKVPLPEEPGSPWVMPLEGLPTAPADTLARLSNWGIRVKSGHFVWNRERRRMCKAKRSAFDVPLVWAQNISPGKLIRPASKHGTGIDFVRFAKDSSAIIRKPAVVMQRTTNNRQHRRLISASIDPSVIRTHGGFVTENHTIVLLPMDDSVDLKTVTQLLSSSAVDAMYRRVAGTASISVQALRELPLPWPQNLRAALARKLPFDKAVTEAYAMVNREEAA
jgi:adenine-specific DNA-methyltransferase